MYCGRPGRSIPAMTTHAPATADRRIFNPVQQDAVTFLETAAESGGTRTLVEVELAPGGGNAPHRHLGYAEHFDVLEGTLTVQLGDTTLPLGPGERAIAPAGTSHCFRNESGRPVVFRVELRLGHTGFERALRIGYGLAADGRTNKAGIPKSPLELAVLVEMSAMRVDGPARVIMPLMGPLAKLARRRGVERRLLDRYVPAHA